MRKMILNINGAGFPFIESIPDDIELEFMDSYRPAGPHGSAATGRNNWRK